MIPHSRSASEIEVKGICIHPMVVNRAVPDPAMVMPAIKTIDFLKKKEMMN
ncbi:MAG: hypothetical protein R3F07_13390 [Opitutaceae bacterium]